MQLDKFKYAQDKGKEEACHQVVLNLHREGMNAPFTAAIVCKSRTEVKSILTKAGMGQ